MLCSNASKFGRRSLPIMKMSRDSEILPFPQPYQGPRSPATAKGESRDDWPWLIAGRREMASDLLIDSMDVLFLIFFWSLTPYCHCLSCSLNPTYDVKRNSLVSHRDTSGHQAAARNLVADNAEASVFCLLHNFLRRWAVSVWR